MWPVYDVYLSQKAQIGLNLTQAANLGHTAVPHWRGQKVQPFQAIPICLRSYTLLLRFGA